MERPPSSDAAPNQDKAAKLEAAKGRYGANRWWESSDPKIVAWHQLQEPVLIVSISDFIQAAGVALGRTVEYQELYLNKDRVIGELKAKYPDLPDIE